MAKFFNIAIATLLMLFVSASCSDSQPTGEGFTADEATKEVDAAGGEYTVGFALSGNDEQVALSVTEDWISSLRATDERQIAFKVAPNFTSEERTADINVRYDGKEYQIHVTQKSVESTATPCKMALTTYRGGGTAELTLSDKGTDEYGSTIAEASYYRMILPLSILREGMPQEGVYTSPQVELEMMPEQAERHLLNASFWETALKADECTMKVTKVAEDKVDILLTGNFGGKLHKLHYNGEVRYSNETADDEWQQHDVSFSPVIATCFYQQKIGLKRDLWTIQLCDVMPDAQGNITGNAHLMYINVIAEKTSDYHLTTGTYPVSLYAEASTIAPGSFGIMPAGTFLVNLYESGKMAMGLAVEGHVKIEHKGDKNYALGLSLKTDKGFYICGLFDGEIPMSGYPTKGESTLTSDYEVKLPSATTKCLAKCYGDFFQNGGTNWVIKIAPENGADDGIQFDLNCAGSDTSKPADGKYYVGEGELGTFHYGYFSDGKIGGTLFFGSRNSTGGIDRYAPALSGEITVKNNSDGTCTFDFYFYDDWPSAHKFYGSWTGKLEIQKSAMPQKKAFANKAVKQKKSNKQTRKIQQFHKI